VINGKRVVVWTPYGRERTYSLLVKYLAREVERGVVDEVWAYMNTDEHGQEDDIAFAQQLQAKLPKWFKLVYRPDGINRHPGPKQRNTGYAYRYMTDEDTVYVRMDDDIVYLHEDAIQNLVKKRIEAPVPVAIFGTTWNNAIVSFFFQQQGLIPHEWGTCQMYCMDPVGWANGQFAVKIHNLLLDRIESNVADQVRLYMDYSIQPGTQFSVSCFASLGSMYAGLSSGPGVLVPDEEESWHTIHEPLKRGVPNLLTGDALVSHFTFQPQQPHVMSTNILDRYRHLAEKLT
jgi:hypothetical protein